MSENERIDTGYAALQTDSDDVPIQVSGIALGDGDITNGGSGKATLWPGDVLKEAPLRGSDEALEGQPIANDQNHTTEETQPQTPSDAIRGGVEWAGYKDGVGVLYEGEVDDPNIARSVKNGRLEVSPLVSRDIEPLEGELKEKYKEQGYDVEAAEYVATDIHAWRDIATVQKGASESAKITVGENPMKAEALTETIEALKADENMAGAHESDSGEETHEALKEKAGVSFTGTATGELDESEIPTDGFEDHYLYPGENKSESSYPVVDADGNLRKGNLDSAWQLGARGDADENHDGRLMDLAEEFDNPPEWANDADAMSGAQVKDPALWEACSVSLPIQSDDGANGGSPQSFGGSSGSEEPTETMTEEDTLTDGEKAILSAAEDVEDATEALQSFADKEDPTVVEADNYEALNSRVDTLKDMMGERLVEDTGLKEGTVESMSFEAMAKEFETEEGDFDAEALVQNPEAGEPDADESGVEALSDDADVDKAEALYNDYQTFGNERLKDDITEALGVSEWDEAKEVLD